MNKEKDSIIPPLERAKNAAEQAYFDNPSVPTYNNYRTAMRNLAQSLLAQKACQGSTMAIIELSKAFPARASVKNITEQSLLEIEDMEKDEFQQYLSKLDFSKSQQIDKLSPSNIIEAFENGVLTFNQTNKYLDILEKMERIKSGGKIDGKIQIEIEEVTKNALYSNK